MKKLLVVLIVCFALFRLSFVSAYPNEYVLIKQFGRIEKVYDTEGIKFKIPILQSAVKVKKSILIYDIAPSDVITKDKKTMVADCFVLWKVIDPIKFIRTLNGNENNAEARINTITFNALKTVISATNQTDVISGRDGRLMQDVMSVIGKTMEEYGIEIVSVETKALDLPNDNKAAVYERMISERQNKAAAFRAEGEAEATKIRTETDTDISIALGKAKADAQKIKAEGEAEYMKILSAAYNDVEKADFYNFVRELDALKASLSKSENKTLILDKDSFIAKILEER